MEIDKRSPDEKILSIPDRDSDERQDRSRTYCLIAIALIVTVCNAILGGLWSLERNIKASRTHEISKPRGRLPKVAVPRAATQSVDLIQPALGNQVQVKIIAVRRIAGEPNAVNVEMQIKKLTNTNLSQESISVGSTMASNSETQDIYQTTDFLRRSSGAISLAKLRRDRPVDAYVVLDVPPGVATINLFVDKTEPFRNVPVASASKSTKPSSSSTTNKTALRTINKPMTQSSELMIRKVLDNRAQIQLISAQRLENSGLPTRNIVNVKLRIWRLATKQSSFQDVINVSATTARNPNTSETYRAFDFLNRATNPVFLFYLRPHTYTDAYVWLQVPQEVDILDIFVPEAGTFRNVSISNN